MIPQWAISLCVLAVGLLGYGLLWLSYKAFEKPKPPVFLRDYELIFILLCMGGMGIGFFVGTFGVPIGVLSLLQPDKYTRLFQPLVG